MAELLMRRPLFPGADYVKQLEYIINYLGAKKKVQKKKYCPARCSLAQMMSAAAFAHIILPIFIFSFIFSFARLLLADDVQQLA